MKDAEVVLCGGTESMSQAPYCVRNARFGTKLGSDLKVGTIKVFKNCWSCHYTNNFNNTMLGERKQILKPISLIGN